MNQILLTLFVAAAGVFWCPFGSSVASALGAEEKWHALLDSADAKERQEARNLLLKRRDEAIDHLTGIVSRPVVQGEKFYDPGTSRNIAIFLLGEYRADRAARFLVDHLVMTSRHDMTEVGSIFDLAPMNTPARVALLKIGCPAISVLMEKIRESPSSDLGRECLITLVALEGVSHSKSILLHKANELTGAEKQHLEQAAARVDDPKVVPRVIQEMGTIHRQVQE